MFYWVNSYYIFSAESSTHQYTLNNYYSSQCKQINSTKLQLQSCTVLLHTAVQLQVDINYPTSHYSAYTLVHYATTNIISITNSNMREITVWLFARIIECTLQRVKYIVFVSNACAKHFVVFYTSKQTDDRYLSLLLKTIALQFNIS